MLPPPTSNSTGLLNCFISTTHSAHEFSRYVLIYDTVIDEKSCKRLIQAARGKPCTFHRAMDSIPKSLMPSQLELLINLGFTSLLTSGGPPDAVSNVGTIKELVEAAKGRIEVIVGGGVRSGNLDVLRETGVCMMTRLRVKDGRLTQNTLGKLVSLKRLHGSSGYVLG